MYRQTLVFLKRFLYHEWVPNKVRNLWSEDIKNEARNLRQNGSSYGQIIKRLGIARSTLFSWIKDIDRPPNLANRDKKALLNEMRKLAVKAHKRLRKERLEKITAKVKNEIEQYDLEDINSLKFALSMLYWAEGSKGRGLVAFANTDPKLALLFITLLRKCYQVDENKFRIRLHLHYYHRVTQIRKFWSELLEIPESKFGKIYLKKRSKTKRFRKNFAGICFIRYYSENLRFELLETGRLLAEKLHP